MGNKSYKIFIKTLIWLACFVAYIIINTLFAALTGYGFGYGITIFVLFFVAKKLCDKWEVNYIYKQKLKADDNWNLSAQEQLKTPTIHRWRCDKCGEMTSTSPCEFCSRDENATSETTDVKQTTYTWKCHRCFNEISSYPCKYCSEKQEGN